MPLDRRPDDRRLDGQLAELERVRSDELLGNPAAERGHEIRFFEDRPRGKVGHAEDDLPLQVARRERAIDEAGVLPTR